MDFGRQRGFLLDGEDPPEKVGCRKKSYFLEFMYVDVARDYYYYYCYYYYYYYRRRRRCCSVFALIRAKTIQVKSLQASTMRITYPVAVNCLGWDNLYCAPQHLHSTRIQKDNSYVRGGYWSALSRQNFHDRTRWPNAFRVLGSDCNFILTVRLQLKMIVLPF